MNSESSITNCIFNIVENVYEDSSFSELTLIIVNNRDGGQLSKKIHEFIKLLSSFWGIIVEKEYSNSTIKYEINFTTQAFDSSSRQNLINCILSIMPTFSIKTKNISVFTKDNEFSSNECQIHESTLSFNLSLLEDNCAFNQPIDINTLYLQKGIKTEFDKSMQTIEFIGRWTLSECENVVDRIGSKLKLKRHLNIRKGNNFCFIISNNIYDQLVDIDQIISELC